MEFSKGTASFRSVYVLKNVVPFHLSKNSHRKFHVNGKRPSSLPSVCLSGFVPRAFCPPLASLRYSFYDAETLSSAEAPSVEGAKKKTQKMKNSSPGCSRLLFTSPHFPVRTKKKTEASAEERDAEISI